VDFTPPQYTPGWIDQSPDRPALDESLADQYVGKLILIGMTYQRPNGELITHRQWAGRIKAFSNKVGIQVDLLDCDEYCALPPDPRGITSAEPGIYTLKATGQIIENPDCVATWTCTRPANSSASGDRAVSPSAPGPQPGEKRGDSMEPVTKQPPYYWLWRVLWLLGFVATNAGAIALFAAIGRADSEAPPWPVFLFPLVMLPEFVLVLALCSPFVFRFRYSLFGRYRRTPWPAETPLAEHRRSGGGIGSFRGTVPFFTWVLFPSGLGFSVLFVGRAFIPLDAMIRVDKARGGWRVFHESNEVRSPAFCPHDDIAERLRNLLGEVPQP
jgi:hypothetical protein